MSIFSNREIEMFKKRALELKIELYGRDSKIDVDVIHLMGIFRDPNNQIYKQRSDQQATPMENPSVV
ncbi:hypothetical protein Lal_00024406 [Lupinus albus]|nr:hypothetical protein Lal_00024406 [Lupinus albus]